MEGIVYDPGSGQILTASFMDDAMQRSEDIPAIAVRSHAVPTDRN